MLKRKRLLSLLCVLSLLVGLFSFTAAPVLAADDTWENDADVSWIDPSKKLVALTFDDGPIGTAATVPSQRILDVMEKYGMHCTFFYWGEKINSSNIAEIERAYSLGCELGNHTYTHPYLTNMSQSQIQEQIKKTNDLLSPISGKSSTLIRPPYGSVNNTVSSSVDAPMINWSRDSADWNNGNYNSVLNQLRNVQDGDIVLLHENYEFTAQAVETAVPELIEKGFVVVTVSELMKMKGIELKVGTLYSNQAVGKPNVYQPPAYESVEAKIDAIGEVTLESEAAIQEAREAYDALTDDQKAQVENYSTLTDAEAALKALQDAAAKEAADKAAAKEVTDKIAGIGEVTLESAAAIQAAREAYDALTDDQKALVANVETLTIAEAALKVLQEAAAKEEADKAAAKAVADQIAAIGEVTLESEAAILAAREAYNALTNDQKALVANIVTLTDAEAALKALQDAAAKEEADKAAAKEVADLIAAIGEVTLESEAAILAAREAYDALTEDQKALVENEAVLTEAEAKLEELQNFFPFTDVIGWYEDAVRYVYKNGLMNGISDTKFDPDGTMTRSMLVTILHRQEGTPTVDYTLNFKDVEAGKWYTEAIRWAASKGIVEGYNNGKFGTNDPITREQMALILQRYAKFSGEDVSAQANLSVYGDARKVSAWALDAMKWAVAAGLITGTPEATLLPQGSATRAQAATILMRFCEPAPEGGKIGIAMPTNDLMRWAQDGANLKAQFEAAGYAVDLQYASYDPEKQAAQIENMIVGGCKVIVAAPIDSEALGDVMAQAKAARVAVIAYDRLIMDTDAVLYYVTFDNFIIGFQQGQYIADALDLDNAKEGTSYNIEFVTGDLGDPNIFLYYNGARSALQKYIDSGVLVCQSGQTDIADVATENWDSFNAQKRFEHILSTYYADKPLHAVMANNDSTAQGVATAITTSYDDDVYPIITGLDCDIVSMINMLDGKQAMSVFKDTRNLTAYTFEIVDAIMKGEAVPINDTTTYDNGTGIIPSYLCPGTVCTPENYKELLIDSGYYTEEELAG